MAKKYEVSKVLMNAQPAEDNQGWVNVSSTIYANSFRDTSDEIVFIVKTQSGEMFPLQIGDIITIPDEVTEYDLNRAKKEDE